VNGERVDQDILVIGAGPAGLAVAGALAMRGRRAVVLERSADVGSSWRGHYDRLRLHTTRRLSGLPGLPIPRSYGRWVARADLVRYLESYRAHFDIDVRTGVEVTGDRARRRRRLDGPGRLGRRVAGRECRCGSGL
jgi:putative flavoprotein involved in K+ transport